MALTASLLAAWWAFVFVQPCPPFSEGHSFLALSWRWCACGQPVLDHLFTFDDRGIVALAGGSNEHLCFEAGFAGNALGVGAGIRAGSCATAGSFLIVVRVVQSHHFLQLAWASRTGEDCRGV